MKPSLRRRSLFASVLAALLLGACATHVPEAEYSVRPERSALLRASDSAEVHVASATGDIELQGYERSRIAGKISQHLKDSAPPSGAARQPPRRYRLDVTITRYEKGNAFARLLLPGLGQIHIDSTVRVSTLPGGAPISAFTVSKTFAWGGIYGATHNIQEIEDPFAQAIANALVGVQDEDAAAPKS